MNSENTEKKFLIKRIRIALGVTQDKLSRVIDCSGRKIQTAKSGKEPTWKPQKFINFAKLIEDRFGIEWTDLPKSFLSTEPAPAIDSVVERLQVEK